MSPIQTLIDRYLISAAIASDAKFIVEQDGHYELTSAGAKFIEYVIETAAARGHNVTAARDLLLQAQADAAFRSLAG